MERNQVSDSNSGGGSSRRLDTLPEECISMVIHHTSPRDACVVASVSKTVKSAAESDLVWEKFLASEYSSLVPPRSQDYSSKKEMYMSLADDSVLIDNGKQKGSGKKCYMLSAMDLKITRSDCPAYWQWKKDFESKFEKVVKLHGVWWFEIRGKIGCGMLSKKTHYSVYLVFKVARSGSHGFEDTPVEAQVGFVGKEASKTFVLLDPSAYCLLSVSVSPVSREVRTVCTRRRSTREEVGGEREEPKERGDGWSEVKLGSFYISDGATGCDDDEIECSVMETKQGHFKSGLIFQGIEIR